VIPGVEVPEEPRQPEKNDSDDDADGDYKPLFGGK